MNSSNAMINDLTKDSVIKKLLIFAYPFALANIIQVFYSLADMAVIGRFVGSSGISGVAIGGDIMNFFMMLGMGFSTSGQVIISQYVGRGDRKGISSVIGTMLSFILSLAIVLTILALCFHRGFLILERTPTESYVDARIYILTCFCGLFFSYGYNAISSILRGMGDSKRPFIFVAVSTVTNIILDLTLVAGLRLGVFGAALGTVLSQALSFILSLIYLYKKRESFGFDFKPKSFRMHKAQLVPIIRLGLPMALQSATISLSFIFVNSFINSYGVIASAITGVGARLSQVIMIIGQASSMAGTVMIGQNFGAGKNDRVKKTVHITLFICLGTALLFTILYNIFPRQIYGLFSTDPEVIKLAPVYIPIVSLGFISFALMTPYMSMVSGIGFGTFCFILAIVEGLVGRAALSYLLGIVFNMGIKGFWLGNNLAAFTTAICAGGYFYIGTWKKRNLVVRVSENPNDEIAH